MALNSEKCQLKHTAIGKNYNDIFKQYQKKSSYRNLCNDKPTAKTRIT